jgi:hypothetical protein
VISAGRLNEGMNKTYCHPRSVTVQAPGAAIGGPRIRRLTSFDGEVKCTSAASKSLWRQVGAAKSLWVTARDGDVLLMTTGDGVFSRE